MLVLTRKVDEQILIGDDIKITVLRVRGNSIRIGIEAPRSTRVIRGELGSQETGLQEMGLREIGPKEAAGKAFTQEIDVELEGPIDDLAEVFAHPEMQSIGRAKKAGQSTNRATNQPANRIEAVRGDVSKAELFVGSVDRSGKNAKLTRSPLAAFVSAS